MDSAGGEDDLFYVLMGALADLDGLSTVGVAAILAAFREGAHYGVADLEQAEVWIPNVIALLEEVRTMIAEGRWVVPDLRN